MMVVVVQIPSFGWAVGRPAASRQSLYRCERCMFPARGLMSGKGNGELIPVGGGDAIPLIRDHLSMGRRESCDICLRFPNISGVHCEMTFQDGYWLIKDMGSTNGIKVNGSRVKKRVLHPG